MHTCYLECMVLLHKRKKKNVWATHSYTVKNSKKKKISLFLLKNNEMLVAQIFSSMDIFLKISETSRNPYSHVVVVSFYQECFGIENQNFLGNCFWPASYPLFHRNIPVFFFLAKYTLKKSIKSKKLLAAKLPQILRDFMKFWRNFIFGEFLVILSLHKKIAILGKWTN